MITAQQDRDRAKQALGQLAEHVGPAAVASAQLPADSLGAESAADSDSLARGHLETIAALESQVRSQWPDCLVEWVAIACERL